MVRRPAARTIAALLDEMATRFGEREALVGSGQRYTYRELREHVRLAARALVTLGVERGDKVAILMGNRPEWVIADLAICLLGGVMVGVNTWATSRELEYVLCHSDATLLVTSGRFLKYDYLAMLDGMEPRSERLPLLRDIIQVGEQAAPGGITWHDLARYAEDTSERVIDAAQRTVRGNDLAYILYTSGSTALPKGVELRHHSLIDNMWDIGERQHVTEADRLWLAVSLFWSLSSVNALFNLLTHGGCVVLQESFAPGEALRLIERERCTLYYGTPNMAQALAEHPDRSACDLSTLRGGATIGTPQQIECVVALGAHEVCNIYGLTETYGNCNVTDVADPLVKRRATVGRALPGFVQKIVDPQTRQPVPPGTVGEILVKGHVTTGYYKDPERTRETFDEQGFFLTGDLGLVDAEGYLEFRGRLKEMVKTGGINVAPVEVEQVLMQHPDVHLAFCVGVPDATRDEVLAAVVIAKPGAAPTVSDLAAHCRKTLAVYKVPRLYHFASEVDLPLTTTGKLQKNRLAGVFFAEHIGGD